MHNNNHPKRKISVKEIAETIGGSIVGDETVQCQQALPLQDAGDGAITLLHDPAHAEQLCASGAVATLVAQPLGPQQLQGTAITQLVVEDCLTAFESVVRLFRPNPMRPLYGVDCDADIDPSARLGESVCIRSGVSIGADTVIGDGTVIHSGVTIMDGCTIGNDVTLYPGVVLYPETVIEDRVTIHAGSIIGANGFGYQTEKGRHRPCAQVGYVHIECDVEVGANVTIDRGSFGATRIGEGTKIDNQVMIAHNCRIGRHNLICSQVGIAGSCTTGDYVVLAGKVGLADHLTLGDQVIVGAQAGVMHDLSEPGQYLGSPAQPLRDQMQIFAALRKLPELRKELKRLAAQVKQLAAGERAVDADGKKAA